MKIIAMPMELQTGESISYTIRIEFDKELQIRKTQTQKSAIIKYPRILVNKIVSPDDNQTDDKWLFFYRAYGLVDVYDNKVAGVYLSNKAGSASA